MRKGEILLRYIEANPGTGATDAFRACGFPIGGVGNPNYEALKRRLATQDWPHVDAYAAAKGEFIESIIAKAHLK